MTEEYKDYLGDSVYASFEDGMVKLTTENGYGSSNIIYLDTAVLAALSRYVERIKGVCADCVGSELSGLVSQHLDLKDRR